MEKEIGLKSFEIKKAKNNVIYTSFLTTEGTINVFEQNLSNTLKENIGCTVKVELVDNGKYKNIVSFIGKTAEGVTDNPEPRDTQDRISSQWAINAAIKILENSSEKLEGDQALEVIKEVAIKLKKMSEEV